ncbi:PREDICTED: uncharacterized protein LOC104813387 [Tarenaya hassleriana]|uniref:uncharacterized protein LOC104813387 n=1 Tax=Tarenaya hassleriana TaxID=28532 RepID=UPI00053C7E4E|nr:PREDICTED: uncharacterized protein LOC104813387 [Tarenaya hassleriana]
MSRRQKKTAKMVTGMMGLCIIVYIAGPPVYWHLNESIAHSLRSSCPPCVCDCSSQPLLSIPEGLNNHSFLDCMKHDLEVSEESERSFTEMVAQELKLREAQAQEDEWRADRALLDAKKAASQYQKEADKCSMGMETCEEAREKAEAALDEQKRMSFMWELRARQRGWKDIAVNSDVL